MLQVRGLLATGVGVGFGVGVTVGLEVAVAEGVDSGVDVTVGVTEGVAVGVTAVAGCRVARQSAVSATTAENLLAEPLIQSKLVAGQANSSQVKACSQETLKKVGPGRSPGQPFS